MRIVAPILALILCLAALSCGGKPQTAAPAPEAGAKAAEKAEPLFEVQVNGLWGFIDRTGRLVVEPKFQEVRGPLDRRGEYARGLYFQDVVGFSENRCAVRLGSKWGFIDGAGKLVIPPQFDNASQFVDGLAPAAVDGRWGYIDPAGKWAIEPRFDFCFTFEGKLARVELDGMMGLIDRAGNFVLEPRSLGWIDPLDEDLTRAQVREKEGRRILGFRFGAREFTSCFIDARGKIAFTLPPHTLAFPFSEGLAVAQVGRKWGYVDRTGKFAIPPQYDEAWSFHDGMALVMTGGANGFIKASGEMAIPARFEEAGTFFESLARVRVEGKYGFIDKTGKMVIAPQFDEVPRSFEHGRAVVKLNGKWGVIDRTGGFLCEPQYDAITDVADSLAVKAADKWGMMDEAGKLVIPPRFDRMFVFDRDLARVQLGDRMGWIDRTGRFVWEPSR